MWFPVHRPGTDKLDHIHATIASLYSQAFQETVDTDDLLRFEFS